PGGAPTARLGGPPAGRKQEKPRRRGRRSNVADAFTGARPQTGGGAVGDFDAFTPDEQHAPGQHRSSEAPWSPATDPQPYVPEPATRPLPPEALENPRQPRPTGGRLGRGLRPFARGRTAEPLTPEPTAISAPLPQPDPISAPLAVTPAPRQKPVVAQPADVVPDGKPPHRKDKDYVDWVSGLGE
ncbi:hypothetical protein AB0F10_21765, partial [Actinoplanes sp. NPDC026623]